MRRFAGGSIQSLGGPFYGWAASRMQSRSSAERGRSPESFNVYDSLGEAYAVQGDRALAIKNYERSIELNPRNKGGIEALAKLREKK